MVPNKNRPTREFLQSSAVAGKRFGLLHLDGPGRAFARTGTAGDARLRVHFRLAIDFDCAHGARAFANAASDADILIHFSSHGILQDWLVGMDASAAGLPECVISGIKNRHRWKYTTI